MSDPHEQANVQQIEWLLGALTETEVPRPTHRDVPAELVPDPEETADGSALH